MDRTAGKNVQGEKHAAALRLLSYKKYYNSFKQYLGDIYLTFLKK